MKIVIDHLTGSRRGQRQELPLGQRVTIGRHPKSDISFDAHRDLDASSRHAELRVRDESLLLVDVGSSNGTFVGGHRLSEVVLEPGEPVEVEFGHGGPRLRIWYGPEDEAPAPVPRDRRYDLRWLVIALIIAAVLALLVRTLAR